MRRPRGHPRTRGEGPGVEAAVVAPAECHGIGWSRRGEAVKSAAARHAVREEGDGREGRGGRKGEAMEMAIGARDEEGGGKEEKGGWREEAREEAGGRDGEKMEEAEAFLDELENSAEEEKVFAAL